ncbi:MAG: TonB-dependent receptor [Bacteroidota bacterium]|nr:TonB-dependent receptor [Bacteroidota bacterium]
MKYLFTWCLSFCIQVLGHTQLVHFFDEDTRQPIEHVFLLSEVPKLSTSSNADGQADVSLFKEVKIIEIRSLAYETIFKTYAELIAIEKISLRKDGLLLDPIVISATRWNQVSTSSPSKILTISKKDIQLQNPQSAADLLALSSEVFIQKSQQGGGSPMIRGFSTNRLLYSVDGVRMNTAIFRSGNLQNVISIDPFAIEKTEILFGPGSVIYGSDAIGGVMSFQTLEPQSAEGEEVLVKGSTLARFASANKEKTAHVDVNVGWKKWAILSSLSSNDFGDLKMGSHGPKEYLRPFYVQRIDQQDAVIQNEDPLIQRPSAYTQINMMQKLQYKPDENWKFQYALHYSATSSYSRYDRHIQYRNGSPRYGEWNYGPQIWMMNHFNILNAISNKFYDQANLSFAIQNFEESRIDRNIHQPDRHIRTENVEAYAINLDFNKSIHTKHKLYYGIEWVLNDVHSEGRDEDISNGISKPGPSRYPQANWSSYAAYLNNEFKISEKMLLQGGIRFNQYKINADFDTTFYPFPFTKTKIQNGAIIGSVGLVYRPVETWILRSNLSTGFRAPNIDDMGKVFDSEAGSVIIPNPDLKAEYAYNMDFGIAKIFNSTIKVDISAYYTYLKDAMVRRDFNLNGQDSIYYNGELSRVQAIQNAAFTRVYGIQAGIEIKLPANFSILSKYNYQVGKEENDDNSTSPSRHAPPGFGVTRLNYTVNKLTLQIYVNYSEGKTYDDLPQEERGKPEIYALDDDRKPFSPTWYSINFKAMVQLNEIFSIQSGLENISDQRYRTYSSGIVSSGRNFILSLKATI